MPPVFFPFHSSRFECRVQAIEPEAELPETELDEPSSDDENEGDNKDSEWKQNDGGRVGNIEMSDQDTGSEVEQLRTQD